MPSTTSATLSDRALNRAPLARQHLSARTTMPAPAMVAHLIAMQAQAPMAPYFGLWSRLEDFTPDTLSAGVLDRSLVRVVTLRSTIHLHTADDARTLRALVQPMIEGKVRPTAVLSSLEPQFDLAALLALGRDLVSREPRTTAAMRPILAERWPDASLHAMTQAINYLLPMVQVPPRGIWGESGQPMLTTLETWTGEALPAEPDIDAIVLRYLAAFGPASVADVQQWSGLTRLGTVFSRLRPHLVSFRGEDGRELFDLPEAPRPNADEPVPVRILAPFDNVLIGYKDRHRILPPGHQQLVFTQNGLIRPTVLVDGFAAGIISIGRKREVATLSIDLFHPIPAAAREEIEQEALRLLAFAEPTATTTRIAFTTSA
ncbi:MAG: winged helix DNA-binding domain-containing protein [Thermomicrobiales bacterium]